MSAMVQTKGFLFLTKDRLLILTDERVIVANPKTKQPRFMNKYSELLGLTKCIRVAANNFIVHFQHRSEEEWFCPRRDELVEIICT